MEPVLTPGNGIPTGPKDGTGPGVETKTNELKSDAGVPDKKIDAARFAALARKEAQAQKLKFEAKKEHEEAVRLRTENEKIGDWLKNAKANPLKALEVLGLTPEDVFNVVTNNGKASPELQIGALRDEFGRYIKQQDELRQKAELGTKQQQDAAVAAQVKRFRSDVADFVKANVDKYELVNIDSAYDLVSAVIEEHFAKTEQLLTKEEAASKVETFLEEQHKKRAMAKKFQQKKEEPVADAKSASKQETTVTKPNTLSNDMTASATSLNSLAKSEQERIARALAALSK